MLHDVKSGLNWARWKRESNLWKKTKLNITSSFCNKLFNGACRWYKNCHDSNCHTICVFVDALALFVTYFISFLILANTELHVALPPFIVHSRLNPFVWPWIPWKVRASLTEFVKQNMFFLLWTCVWLLSVSLLTINIITALWSCIPIKHATHTQVVLLERFLHSLFVFFPNFFL